MHVYVAKLASLAAIAFQEHNLPGVRHVTGMNSEAHPFRFILRTLSQKTFKEHSF